MTNGDTSGCVCKTLLLLHYFALAAQGNSAGAAEITSLQSSQSFTTDCHLRSYLRPAARLNPLLPSCRDGELQFPIPKSPTVGIHCKWHSRELANRLKFFKQRSEPEGELLGGDGMLSLHFYQKEIMDETNLCFGLS